MTTSNKQPYHATCNLQPGGAAPAAEAAEAAVEGGGAVYNCTRHRHEGADFATAPGAKETADVGLGRLGRHAFMDSQQKWHYISSF
eukprot:gene10890-2965_t